MSHDLYAHWRDSGRIPRLWLIDARGSLTILLVLLHMRVWTFSLMFFVILFLIGLQYYRMPIPVFFRVVLGALVGKRKVIYL
jgi:hypothetical protein